VVESIEAFPMTTSQLHPAGGRKDRSEQEGLWALGLVSVLAGAASGFIGALFRLVLERADLLRASAIARAHGMPLGFALVVSLCAVATAAAAWLVRRFSPEASGSGIPHVETVLDGEAPSAGPSLIPVKFVGGVLAIGSGLALGREGPTVQMGASISHILGSLFRRSPKDCLTLVAAGAGAGLATAFNAPIAGAVFVLEELVRRFDTRIAIAALGASASAIAIARLHVGHEPDFAVPPLPYMGIGTAPAYLILGAVAGFLGVAYNRTILGAMGVAERLRLPVELRAGLVGAAVGVLAWFAGDLVGGGDPITQRALGGATPILAVALVFLLRFALGPVSYSAGTPGGLFAPMLVLGAQAGLLVGVLCRPWFPAPVPDSTTLAIVGMAAFFTASVRAPVTGMVLVTEMTGSFTLLLPMLGACFVAMLAPTVLQDPPIYDSLKDRDPALPPR
jgi:CIC family chloride channel protein